MWPRSRIALRASAGRVAVVGENAEAVVQARGQVVQFGELILRQRLGGKEIQRARVRIFEHRVQDRQVVAKRFSRGRGRHHHDVAPVSNGLRGQGLVAVELRDAFVGIDASKLFAHPSGHGRKLGLAGRRCDARR